jgi:hypothetical protein
MLKRTLTALALAAVGLPAIIYGGVFYYLLMDIHWGGAWEYARLYRAVQFEPNEIITVGGVLVIATARFFFADFAIFAMVVFVLLAMTVHIIAYERGRDKAALDFSVTVTGSFISVGWDRICWICAICPTVSGG